MVNNKTSVGDAHPGPSAGIGDLIGRLARVSLGAQYHAGLNPAQWETLRFLARANRYSCTPTVLAEYLGTTKGTVSQTLISLESKGFIRRERGKADRRSVSVAVTDAGRSLLQSDPVFEIDAACAQLADIDCTQTKAVLSRLLGVLRAAQDLPEFGLCRTCGLLAPCLAEAGNAERRCGMTGDPLAEHELDQLCINFRRPS